MDEYKIPEIEINIYPPREYVLEHQVQIYMQIVMSCLSPTASYVYQSKERNNVVMLFLDGILITAKFRQIKFVEKFSESITHELFHSHVWQGFHEHFNGEELYANRFSQTSSSPPPMDNPQEIKCKDCGKKSYWGTCPVCSKELVS